MRIYFRSAGSRSTGEDKAEQQIIMQDSEWDTEGPYFIVAIGNGKWRGPGVNFYSRIYQSSRRMPRFRHASERATQAINGFKWAGPPARNSAVVLRCDL